MDRKLHNELVKLVLKIPDIDDYSTRTNLLINIPITLPRSQTNKRTDISSIVNNLAEMRLLNGEWALLIFIDNAILQFGETTDSEELKELRRVIEASLQPKEQDKPPPGPAQSNPPSSASSSSYSVKPSADKKQAPSSAGFPHGYALIIGISSYADERLKLSPATLKDATDMHTVLRAAEYCGYQDKHVELLPNHEATAENICQKLEWLAEATKEDEQATAIFYFSGHGGRVEIDGQVSHYLLPFDCDLNNLDGTAITGLKLSQLLHAIRSPRLLVLLDNCYSGGMDEIKGVKGEQGTFKYGLGEDYYAQLAQGQGRVILASSGPDETSRALPDLNNSLFTHYLLKALRGEDPSLSQGDSLIRVYQILHYVDTKVREARPQHPMVTAQRAENFPVALYRGGRTKMSVDKIKLREAVIRAFGLEDLHLLCASIENTLRLNGIEEPFSLDIAGGIGTGLPARVQNMIDYCERRGWLNYLIAEIHKARPNLSF